MRSGREALRNVGQGVLLDAVTAYTNGGQRRGERSNVSFLRALAITQRRLKAGDVTPTDTRRPRRASAAALPI